MIYENQWLREIANWDASSGRPPSKRKMPGQRMSHSAHAMHLRITARDSRHPGGFCGESVPAQACVDPFRYTPHVRAAALRITRRTQLGVVNLPLTAASSAINAAKRLSWSELHPLTGKEARWLPCFSPSNRLAFMGASHIS